MQLDSLTELYVAELQNLYDAERQVAEALPKMKDAATSKELQKAFEDHLEQTRHQIERLDQIFNELEERPGGVTCRGMQALIAEGEEVIATKGDAAVRDAALICAAQKIEHYEIAVYGCARTFADLMGESEAAEALLATLEEEERTDKNLTYLAKGLINIQAAEA